MDKQSEVIVPSGTSMGNQGGGMWWVGNTCLPRVQHRDAAVYRDANPGSRCAPGPTPDAVPRRADVRIARRDGFHYRLVIVKEKGQSRVLSMGVLRNVYEGLGIVVV